jgi:hypothetical protein
MLLTILDLVGLLLDDLDLVLDLREVFLQGLFLLLGI